MAKKNTYSATVQTTIRLEVDVLRRAEALVPFVTSENGVESDRVKVLRTAIMIGLKDLERRRAETER